MRVVVAGGGIVGLALARHLRARGLDPVVLERMPAGAHVARGYMLGHQGYASLEALGLLEGVRAAGWEIAPQPGGGSVAIGVEVGRVLALLADGVPVRHRRAVTALTRDGDGRVTGVVADGPDGPEGHAADLVVACDGLHSPVRAMAGITAVHEPLGSGMLHFLSPVPPEVPFAMRELSGEGFVGVFGWPEGSAGFLSTLPVGAERALAPPLTEVRATFARLLPPSATAVAGVTRRDQVRYYEPELMSCPAWWRPGVVVIGDAAHFFGPETGGSSGLGLGDAHALAEAVAAHPGDPDAACREYVRWREPAVRPYEAVHPARAGRRGTPLPAHTWPPPGETEGGPTAPGATPAPAA